MPTARNWRFLICVAVAIAPSTAAAYCPGTDRNFPDYNPRYYSVAKEFARSRYVILGTMERETWIGEDGRPKRLKGPFQSGEKRPWGFDPYVGAYYDVRVEHSFKVTAPAHLRLFSENSTARFWLRRGPKYLMFITLGSFDPPMRRQLSIDTCGNSIEAIGHQKRLREVRQLAPKR